MYTIQHLIERANLRRDRRIGAVVRDMWEVGDMKKERGELTRDAYRHFICMLHKALIPDISREEADAAAAHDWEHDSGGRRTMTYTQFHSSMFELADMWCESIDAEEYAQFLTKLVNTMVIMDGPEVPPPPKHILSPRERKERKQLEMNQPPCDQKRDRGAVLANKRYGPGSGDSVSAVLSLGSQTSAKLNEKKGAKAKGPNMNRRSSWKSFEDIKSPLASAATNKPDTKQKVNILGRRGSRIEEGAVSFVEDVRLARRRSSTKSAFIRQQSERFKFTKDSAGGFQASSNTTQPRKRSLLSAESAVPGHSPSRPAGGRPSAPSPRAGRKGAAR
jgi:hypothetical protein